MEYLDKLIIISAHLHAWYLVYQNFKKQNDNKEVKTILKTFAHSIIKKLKE